MKNFSYLLCFLMLAFAGFGQPSNLKGFKMAGTNPEKKEINQTIGQSSELQIFGSAPSKIYGLSISGQAVFDDNEGFIRVILIDAGYNEYLVYEMYPLMADNRSVTIDDLSEETCLLDGVTPKYLKVELENASLTLSSLSIASGAPRNLNIKGMRAERIREQASEKIKKLNENLQAS